MLCVLEMFGLTGAPVFSSRGTEFDRLNRHLPGALSLFLDRDIMGEFRGPGTIWRQDDISHVQKEIWRLLFTCLWQLQKILSLLWLNNFPRAKEDMWTLVRIVAISGNIIAIMMALQ